MLLNDKNKTIFDFINVEINFIIQKFYVYKKTDGGIFWGEYFYSMLNYMTSKLKNLENFEASFDNTTPNKTRM